MKTPPALAFMLESVNQARLFAPVIALLRAQGQATNVLCTDATAAGREARRRAAEADWEICDLPAVGDFDVWLPLWAARMVSARRRLRDAITAERYRCLIVGNDIAPVSSHLVESARRCGVPTVLVQDGVRPLQRPALRQPLRARLHHAVRLRLMTWSARAPIYGGRALTAVAAAGRALGDTLRRAGLPTDHVRVVGAPAYDAWADQLALRPRPVAEPPDAVVLFAQQDLDGLPREESVRFCRAVIRRVCLEAGQTLVCKLHPRSALSPALMTELEPAASKRLVVPDPLAPIGPLLDGTVVLVTAYSTVALEAIYRGVPVLFADWTGCPFYLAGPEHGAELGWVGREEDLPDMLRRALTDADVRAALWNAQRAWAETHVLPPDGRAAERIATLIAECAVLA